MKKLLTFILCLFALPSVYAGDLSKISLRIAAPNNHNKYFLCLYGVGCLSIKAGNRGKSFGTMYADIGNIKNFVITDASTLRMHLQPTSPSCNVVLDKGQHLTISGQLAVINNKPHINNLQCAIS